MSRARSPLLNVGDGVHIDYKEADEGDYWATAYAIEPLPGNWFEEENGTQESETIPVTPDEPDGAQPLGGENA